MTEETRLAIREMNLQDTLTLGETLARSGYFSDAKQTAQAVVKILAGRELGLGPIASMGGINIVQGHPTIGANAIATLVQAHPVYGYRVKTHTEERCEIAFYQDGDELGRSMFTMADAAKAGLAGKPVWKQYPRNMLFARAMSNGARWYCPAVFSGVPIYTPEELGAEVNGDGDIIDVSPTPLPDEQPEPEPEPQTPAKPGEQLKMVDRMFARVQEETGAYYNAVPHMLHAIRKQREDETWNWPHQDDTRAWADSYNIAVTYAKNRAGRDEGQQEMVL